MNVNYEVIRKYFFNSYKSFIDFVSLTHNDEGLYCILILKKRLYNNLSKINVVIRDSQSGDMYNEYSNNIILNNYEADKLIDDIRDDFVNNHYIAYSSVNPKTNIQTLQNTRFSLNIKLININEFERAMIFNNSINNHKRKSLQMR